MSAWIPEIEGWMKVLGVTVGVVMAVLVPIRSWIVEDRRYRAEMLKAASTASQTVSAAITGPALGGNLLCSTIAIEGLTHAVQDCARAIREGISADSIRENDRLARALERFMSQA